VKDDYRDRVDLQFELHLPIHALKFAAMLS
jgi:hypothetical protein